MGRSSVLRPSWMKIFKAGEMTRNQDWTRLVLGKKEAISVKMVKTSGDRGTEGHLAMLQVKDGI